MKPINHHVQKYLIRIVIILALLIAMYLEWGCNTVKHTEKLNNKAFDRVNSNPTLQAQTASIYLDAHPPIEGKPEIKYIPGETIIQQIPDTNYRNKTRDSLLKQYNSDKLECGKNAMDAYDLGWDEAEKYFKNNTFKQVDTLLKTIPDLREANRQKDSVDRYKKLYYTLLGKSAQQDIQISELNKKIKSLTWLLILAGILLGLSIALTVKSLLTKTAIPFIK